MTARFRITVDQAAIAEGRAAIHVHDTRTDERFNCGSSLILSNARIVQSDEPQQDGARVWVECDAFVGGAADDR